VAGVSRQSAAACAGNVNQSNEALAGNIGGTGKAGREAHAQFSQTATQAALLLPEQRRGAVIYFTIGFTAIEERLSKKLYLGLLSRSTAYIDSLVNNAVQASAIDMGRPAGRPPRNHSQATPSAIEVRPVAL
jgi:hypothetical protein